MKVRDATEIAARFLVVLSISLLCSGCARLNSDHQISGSQAPIKRIMSASPILTVGSKITNFRGISPSGQAVSLDLAHRNHKTLLFVLSPACPYCRINFHNWRTLQAEIRPKNIVWLDVTGTVDAPYMATVGIPDDAKVIRLTALASNVNAKLTVTPTTILLDRYGKVIWICTGPIKTQQMQEAEALIHS